MASLYRKKNSQYWYAAWRVGDHIRNRSTKVPVVGANICGIKETPSRARARAQVIAAHSSGGKQITPFAIYRKKGRAYLRGGLVHAGGTIIKVPDTDVGPADGDYSKTSWYVGLQREGESYKAVIQKTIAQKSDN